MQSALHGLQEMFLIANYVSEQSDLGRSFEVKSHDLKTIRQQMGNNAKKGGHEELQVVILLPTVDMGSEYYLSPGAELKQWLLTQHTRGSIICGACAGVFIVASTGLLQNRLVTTHWNLAQPFHQMYPNIRLDINKILINDGDIITAAGLMSWIDLGLELVAQFGNPAIMRQVGKLMVVDTGRREQRYYQSFSPKLDHGDRAVLKAQHHLQSHYAEPIQTSELPQLGNLTGRTFLRRFVKATGLKPNHYLQRLRVQKACDLIESTNYTFEYISSQVGYEDSSACRKTFQKIVGLTPKQFKARFSSPPRWTGRSAGRPGSAKTTALRRDPARG